MKKKLGMGLIALGFVFLMSAGGNDNMYQEMGRLYPITSILLWGIGGIACLLTGCVLLNESN